MSETQSTPTLPTYSWLGHLAEDDRELLSSYGEFFPGHIGSVIIEEGASQTEVFVVISGELEVHGSQSDGTETLLARLGPGQTLGEISLFHPGPATATVRASEFSQLWRIADSDLMQFMEENPGAGNVLLRTLATIFAQRLRQVDPEAFGLSAYAVVESPELQAQDAATASELEEEDATILELTPSEELPVSPVIPLPTEVPVKTVESPVIPLPVPAQAAATNDVTLLRPTLHVTPVPLTDEAPLKFDSTVGTPSSAGATGAPGPETLTSVPTAPHLPSAARETALVPDPDELEPL